MKKEVKVNNDISELDKIVQELEDMAGEWNFSPKTTFNINLVLDEIFTNIVSYAFDDKDKHEISIRYNLNPDEKLNVEVEDDGKEFNPLNISAEDEINKPLEEREIGGLGIHFLKQFMTDLDYRREKNKNILSFATKINV